MAGSSKKAPARKPAPKPKAEPAQEPAQESINIRDPRAQRVFDIQRLDEVMRFFRQQLAQVKVDYVLAHIGSSTAQGDNHPNRLRESIARNEKAIGVVNRLYDRVGETGLPGGLEVLGSGEQLADSVEPPFDIG